MNRASPTNSPRPFPWLPVAALATLSFLSVWFGMDDTIGGRTGPLLPRLVAQRVYARGCVLPTTYEIASIDDGVKTIVVPDSDPTYAQQLDRALAANHGVCVAQGGPYSHKVGIWSTSVVHRGWYAYAQTSSIGVHGAIEDRTPTTSPSTLLAQHPDLAGVPASSWAVRPGAGVDLLGITLLVTCARAVFGWLRTQGRGGNACPFCGYSLAGLTPPVMCPECGRPASGHPA